MPATIIRIIQQKHKGFFLFLLFTLISTEAYTFPTSVDELVDLPLTQLVNIEIATGHPIALEKAPSVATIITSEDIKARGL